MFSIVGVAGRCSGSVWLAHTVPCLVAPLYDGGYSALHRRFYKPGGFEVKKDTVVLVLCVVARIGIGHGCTRISEFSLDLFSYLSVPDTHHGLYEAFYFSYFFLAVTYLGLCFWHVGQEGDSWAYLWATLALWLLSVLVRLFHHSQALKLDSPPW